MSITIRQPSSLTGGLGESPMRDPQEETSVKTSDTNTFPSSSLPGDRANVSRRIAVVDDDPRIRRALEITLTRHGYNPVLYESAEEFLSHNTGSSVACLLLDVHMPDVSGLDLLRQLPKSSRTFPIIMLTSETDLDIEEEALLAGASSFLIKGSSNLVVLAAIEQAIS